MSDVNQGQHECCGGKAKEPEAQSPTKEAHGCCKGEQAQPKAEKDEKHGGCGCSKS